MVEWFSNHSECVQLKVQVYLATSKFLQIVECVKFYYLQMLQVLLVLQYRGVVSLVVKSSTVISHEKSWGVYAKLACWS